MVGDRGSQTQTQSWLHLNMNTFAGVKMCIKTGGLAPGGTKGRRSPLFLYSSHFDALCICLFGKTNHFSCIPVEYYYCYVAIVLSLGDRLVPSGTIPSK